MYGLHSTRAHAFAALDTLGRIDLRQPEPLLTDGLPGAKGHERAAMVLRATVLVYYQWHKFFSPVFSDKYISTGYPYDMYKCNNFPLNLISLRADLFYRRRSERVQPYTYFFNSTWSMASLNELLGMAPVAIWGLSFIGIKSIEGMLRMPNSPASSCSSSVFTL